MASNLTNYPIIPTHRGNTVKTLSGLVVHPNHPYKGNFVVLTLNVTGLFIHPNQAYREYKLQF